MGLNIDEVVTLYTESLSFTAEGGEDAIEFDLLCDWEASISEEADWLTLSEYSGIGGWNYIYVTAKENKSIEAREAVITIYNDIYEVSKEVTVYQEESNTPYIALSNNKLELDENESSKSIEVESNIPWSATIVSNPDWLTTTPTKGDKGTTTLKVTVKNNYLRESRSAIIKIENSEYNISKVLTINQKKSDAEAYIKLSEDSATIRYKTPYTLNIESSITWSAEYDADIVSVTPNTGIGKVDATITIMGQPTESATVRFYNNVYGISTTLHITPEYTNCIIYTTSDSNIVSPRSDEFSTTIISNEIINGVGAIVFDDSVTTIGDYAFQGCNSLTSVTIGDSITTIGSNAFRDCSSLTSVTIPDSVTMIGDYVFYRCSNLTIVTIGDSVTTIGKRAFEGCSSLTSVYCKATTPPAVTLDYNGYWWTFDGNASSRKIYVPMESVEAYKSAEGWSEYADAIVGYDF